MTAEGPRLERLTRRLAECPPEFLAEPVIGSCGTIRTDAVVADLFLALGDTMLDERAAPAFQGANKEQRNTLRLVQVAAWLVADPAFAEPRCFARPAYEWLVRGIPPLAKRVAAESFVTDPDRREELARLCLQALGLRPAGETDAQAQDRLDALSTVERERVVRETKAAVERARQVREALRRKEAAEAAAKEIRE